VFGRKDYQQAMLVRRMVADLDFPITIDAAPTVRERDGLALSSRNSYLSPDQRRSALALSNALQTIETAWRRGTTDSAALRARGMEALGAPGVVPEYLALVDENLEPVATATAQTVALVAARVGTTRLIDNVVLGDGVARDPTV
jgi:pantoate--beta-alanine ligase